MTGFTSFIPVISNILGSAMAPSAPSAPAPIIMPPAPAPAPVVTPEAPKVAAEVTKAGGDAPVIDTEAARARNLKRRKARKQQNLFSLSEDEVLTTTKSLLGD